MPCRHFPIDEFPPSTLLADAQTPHLLDQKGMKPTAFYIDCSRHSGLGQATGRLKCARTKGRFHKRTMVEQLPDDRNCNWIYYILNRRTRQWYKCCAQGGRVGMFEPHTWKCVEAMPSAWFPARTVDDVEMPFQRTEVQECFRPVPPARFGSPGCTCSPRWCLCDRAQEQCVRIGDRGQSSHWTGGEDSQPGVSIYMLGAPPCDLLTGMFSHVPPAKLTGRQKYDDFLCEVETRVEPLQGIWQDV